MPLKRLIKYGLIGCGAFAVVASYNVGWTIAQSARDDGIKSGAESTKANAKDTKKEGTGGIDPELGTIQEPDLSDVQPALRTDGSGNWKTPEQIARDKAKSQAERDAEALLAAERNSANSDELPKLSPPKVPVIPINILFPQSQTNVGVKSAYANEIRGDSALFFGINRETGQSLKFRIQSGRAVRFNQLTIIMKGCFRSNPNEEHESWAYVDVIDNGEPARPQLAVIASRNRAKGHHNTGPKLLKHGWIIASSPDVTPIDHPTLNVSLLRCEGGVGQQAAVNNANLAKLTGNSLAKTNKPKPAAAKPVAEKKEAEPVEVKAPAVEEGLE